MKNKVDEIIKEVFLKDLKKYVGKEIQQPFLIKKVTKSTRGNESLQKVILSDSTGTIEARVYAENIKEEYKNYENKIVLVTGMVVNSQDKVDVLIANMRIQETYNIGDYTSMVVKDNEEMLRNELFNYIDMIENNGLSTLTKRIFLNNRIFKALTTLPAGLNNHNYCGALLVHTLEVVKLTLASIDSFLELDMVRPYKFSVDRDLVITAALLHDIGNYSSFSCFPEQKLTARGYKIPVSAETISIIDGYNTKLPKEQQYADMIDLKHIILATCGDISPKTIEALIVANANRMAEELDSFGHTFYQHDKNNTQNDDCIVISNYLGYEVMRKSSLDTRKVSANENVDNNKQN